MTQSPKVFISFNLQDSKDVRMLFYALKQQEVEVWDYSGKGQELPLGKPLQESLRERIDSSDYFIAVISPKSIDEQIGYYSRFEVLYALSTEKFPQNKILPVILNGTGEKWVQWKALYRQLDPIKRIELDSVKNDDFEDHLREICGWLSINYIPSSLRSKKTFFSETFMKEADEIDLRHADFVQLMNIMNSCADKVEKGDWQAAKERTELFLLLAGYSAPRANFFYPLIIRGVCELELNDPESAKRTFWTAIANDSFKESPLYGLGFAGLGKTHFSLGQYDEAYKAYQKASDFMSDDKFLFVNQLNSLIHTGSDEWDEAMLDKFEQIEFPPEYRFKLMNLKGVAKYKKRNFSEAAQIFSAIELEALDEAAAIYYALSLMEIGAENFALNVLSFSAIRIDTLNIYHYLADCYLRCGRIPEALGIYKGILCHTERRKGWKRQYFIEYARILKTSGERKNKKEIQMLCEKALDLESFPFPPSKEDFFYLGFASYLLERMPEARLDFGRSQGFCKYFYDNIV